MSQQICFWPGVDPQSTPDRSWARFHDVADAPVIAQIKGCADRFPVLYGVGGGGCAVIERCIAELDGHLHSACLAVTTVPLPGQRKRARCRDPLGRFSKRVTGIWFVGLLGGSDFDLLMCLADYWASLGVKVHFLALVSEDFTTDDWDRAVEQLHTFRERHPENAGTLACETDANKAPGLLLRATGYVAEAGQGEGNQQ